MRNWTLIIAIALFGQLSCSNEDLDIKSFNDDSSITTLNGTWKVLSFENYTDNIQEFKNEDKTLMQLVTAPLQKHFVGGRYIHHSNLWSG